MGKKKKTKVLSDDQPIYTSEPVTVVSPSEITESFPFFIDSIDAFQKNAENAETLSVYVVQQTSSLIRQYPTDLRVQEIHTFMQTLVSQIEEIKSDSSKLPILVEQCKQILALLREIRSIQDEDLMLICQSIEPSLWQKIKSVFAAGEFALIVRTILEELLKGIN